MTGKADFSADEWELLLEGPPTAGSLVVLADRGGTFRETFSMAKAYTEARKQHGESELLDEIVSTKPKADRPKVGSFEELKELSLQKLRDVAGLLGLTERVAEAHAEGGERVSGPERAVISEIRDALWTAPAG